MTYFTKEKLCSECTNLFFIFIFFYFPNSVVVWVVTVFKTDVEEAIACHHI